MSRLRIFWSALAMQCLWSMPCLASPTINQALDVLRAESACVMADPSAVFTAPHIRDLSRLQISAMHEANDDLVNDILTIQRIRRDGKYDLASIYRAKCLTGGAWRQAIVRLKPGEIFVVENYAWVPLLAEGEYFGAGLSFRKQGAQWLFNGFSTDYLGSSPRIEGLLRLVHTEFDQDEISASQCQMPEAPELSEELYAAKLDALETQEAEDDDYDERNALAVAMRNAVRFYAEGKQAPPLPIAQMMMAEVLLRSLDYHNAPEAGTAIWAARVQRAAMFIDRAEARAVNLDRVAPLLTWLGQSYWYGVGDLSPDSARAKHYLELAARWGDEEAATFLSQPPQLEQSFEPDILPRPSREFMKSVPIEIAQCQ